MAGRTLCYRRRGIVLHGTLRLTCNDPRRPLPVVFAGMTDVAEVQICIALLFTRTFKARVDLLPVPVQLRIGAVSGSRSRSLSVRSHLTSARSDSDDDADHTVSLLWLFCTCPPESSFFDFSSRRSLNGSLRIVSAISDAVPRARSQRWRMTQGKRFEAMLIRVPVKRSSAWAAFLSIQVAFGHFGLLAMARTLSYS